MDAVDQPKHDAESLAMEEWFGIPTISLSFPDGRVVIPVDARKFTRACKEASAALREFSDAYKRPS